MPLVQISLWPGRSDEVKEKMIAEVTEVVSRTSGAPPEAVEVIIHEVPKTNWGLGGKPFAKTHPE